MKYYHRLDRILPAPRTALLVAFSASLFLTGSTSYAGDKSSVEAIQEDLQRVLKRYDHSDVVKAFGDFGISLPGTLGFRGMQYSGYEFQRDCWEQGPKAGLLKNDNCITYQSTCSLTAGGSKITVNTPEGETESTTYKDGRMVYVCETTIHLPPDEEPVFLPGAAP